MFKSKYRVWVRHKGEKFYSLVINGGWPQYIRWKRKHHQKTHELITFVRYEYWYEEL